MVDNTVPIIGDVSWTPKNQKKTKRSRSFCNNEGSGIENVTLWFRRLGGEWQNMLMIFENGNWTCTIPDMMKTHNNLLHKCFDKAGISAKTTENYYIVKAAGKGGVAPAAEGFHYTG